MNHKIEKNIVLGVGSRIAILAMSIILPRLILVSFGSEANGLLNTVGQIFSYVALMEAGIGNASLNALYKPLQEKDYTMASRIFVSSSQLFRRTTVLYAVCVLLLTFVLPFVVDTTLSKMTVALVVLFQGLSGISGYWFISAYKTLFTASGDNYYLENSQLGIHILTTLGKILLIHLGADIVWLQVMHLAVTWVGILFLRIIARKRYSWLQPRISGPQYPLKERRAFVIHELAGTVFSCTDLIMISAFCGLAVSSVYTVYNLVFSSLTALLATALSGTVYLLGQAYHRGSAYFTKMFDVFDRVYNCLSFSIMTVACALTLPFIRLYTAGVNDAQYIDVFLPYLFTFVALLSACRAVSSRAIAIAGHAEQTQKRAIIEMVINLIGSVILVGWLGIHGALLGTIVALLYRVVDFIIYTNHKILNRSCVKSVCFYSLMFLLTISEAFVLNRFANSADSYMDLIVYGIVFLLIVALINFSVVFLCSRKDVQWLRNVNKTPLGD